MVVRRAVAHRWMAYAAAAPATTASPALFQRSSFMAVLFWFHFTLCDVRGILILAIVGTSALATVVRPRTNISRKTNYRFNVPV